jgi:hypothetical protein
LTGFSEYVLIVTLAIFHGQNKFNSYLKRLFLSLTIPAEEEGEVEKELESPASENSEARLYLFGGS